MAERLKSWWNSHSNISMRSLETFFKQSQGPIYLTLEVTYPDVFPSLEHRALSGQRTIFLMPRKGPAALRSNVELGITVEAFPDLYTSAIAQEAARFDVCFDDSRSTRDGDILQVVPNTSLYGLIRARYEQVLTRSCPLW